jgi:hypothetical protein
MISQNGEKYEVQKRGGGINIIFGKFIDPCSLGYSAAASLWPPPNLPCPPFFFASFSKQCKQKLPLQNYEFSSRKIGGNSRHGKTQMDNIRISPRSKQTTLNIL